MKRFIVVAVMLSLLMVAAPAAMANSTATAFVQPFMGVFAEYESDLSALGDEMTYVIPVSFRSYFGFTSIGLGVGGRYYIGGQTHDGIYAGASAMVFIHSAGVAGAGGTDFVANVVGGYKYKLSLDALPNDLVLDGGLSLMLPGGFDLGVGSMLRLGVGYAF